MSKINLLDSEVFNRIAAGEVVERPCSVIKELFENSVDAGANTVIAEIKHGGIDFIRITDNGCGMDAEDLEKAFLPHATSKIKTLDNLNAISTLGFRGEALSSIASVAKVTLISRTADSEIGNYIVVENGKVLEKGEKGCPQGTTVTVEDLFKNVPARAKFLSKPSTEESVISDMLSRLIMANYTLSVKYIADGKTVYQSAGDSFKNSVYAIYGKNYIDNILPIECIMPDITLKGFIGKPYFTKPNRTYQTLIVNGRYVINADISFCIFNCYRDFLMKRQFPTYVLELELPNDMVDVNVHPNKMEVKFVDCEGIKRLIYKTVENAISQAIAVPKELIEPQEEVKTPPVTITSREVPEPSAQQIDLKQSLLGTFFTLSQSSKPSSVSQIKSPNVSSLQSDLFAQPSEQRPVKTEPEPQQLTITDEVGSTGDFPVLQNFKVKTVLFDTYIVIEQSGDILIIDQHAAHERLLYDKLAMQYENNSVPSQNMLLPYIFNATPIDSELLRERLDEINSCGFTLTALSGTTFSLSAIPLVCASMEVERFVSLIFDGLGKMKYRKIDFVKDILMQSACKAAIKGEDKLDDSEIEYLVNQFTVKKVALTCPHGRPLVIKIGRSEIEKWFKRVV